MANKKFPEFTRDGVQILFPDDEYIEDSKVRDAVNMYQLMLKATKETFGDENMTENVIIKAIEAGSFGAWRSIMGAKNETVKLIPNRL